MLRKTLVVVMVNSLTSFSQIAEKINLNSQDPYDNSYPNNFTKVGGAVLFVSESCEHGEELWRINNIGETKVFDIVPGSEGSEPGLFKVIGNDMYFKADSSVSNSSDQLFIYNSILDSVYKVAPAGWRLPANLIEYNSKLYCTLKNALLGLEIWEITSSGNTQISNSTNSVTPSKLYSTPIGIFFNGSDALGVELWLYDGFTNTMVADIAPGSNSSSPSDFHWFNDTLYFKADNGIVFDEPWFFDGSSINLVQDINPIGGSDVQGFFSNNDFVYFKATSPSTGYELRVLNDNVLATIDIFPGSSSSNPTSFFNFGNEIYFVANDGVNGSELWKYSAGVAMMMTDINPGSASSLNPNPMFTLIAGELYFIANHASYGYGIWKTNGTVVTMELDFPGTAGYISSFTHCNGKFYFAGNDITGNNQLWQYDGATYNLIEINLNGGSAPSWLTAINDSLYFGATDGLNGIEPFVYDGTSVELIANTDEYSMGIDVNRIDTLNGEMFLNLGSPLPGPEYFSFDGNSIIQVTDSTVNFSTDNGDFINYWNGSENVILFKGATSDFGSELWEFNGNSLVQIADIWPGTGNGYPGDFLEYNGMVLFSAQEPTMANELWYYDGNTISILADINPTGGSLPILGLVFDNKVFLSANDGTNGKELWAYDGVNCNLVIDINPGPGSSNPHAKIIYDNKLIFTANNGALGTELYSWDGISLNLLADINPGAPSSNPSNFIINNGILYFSAQSNATGEELWSYSSVSGVQLVGDINPGPSGSIFYEGSKTVLNSKLVFVANNGTAYRLFVHDGITTTEIGYPTSINIDGYSNLITYGNNVYLTINQDPYYPLYRYNGYNLVPVESSDSAEYLFPLWIRNDVLYGLGGYYCEENYLQSELWKIDDSTTQTQFTNINVSACESYDFNGVIEYHSGTYYQTYTDYNGGDSIIVLDLIIYQEENTLINQTACASYNFYGNELTASGVYTEIFANQYGCDSIETLELIIYQPQESYVEVEGCDSVEYLGQWFKTTGIYDVSLSDIHGCDSIVHVNATVHLIAANAIIMGETVYALPGITQQYQWLDCNNNFAAISGETGDQYAPTESGEYAVEITSDENCVDTSSCVVFLIDDTGISEENQVQLNAVFTNQRLVIDTDLTGEKKFIIYDSKGAIVLTAEFTEQHFELNVAEFATGVYFVQVQSGSVSAYNRIYIQ